jgi:glycosyltransferase involved in cell wall biosynthesis
LTKEGFNKVFIRISTSSALIAILISFFKNLEVYYWHSGTVKEFNDSVPFGIKKIKNYFFSALPFNLVKKYTKWFVTGPESMKDYYIENYNIKPSKILILYNDIDLQRFNSCNEEKKDQLKLSLGISVSKKTILFVHRLSPVRKSLYYLPYVLERFYEKNYTEFETVIIGEGSELEKLRQLVSSANLNDKVKILGGKPNNIIQQYYNIADIFINPTYTEGFPRVLIEAMAAGLPIVTTDAGGIKDIIDEKQRQLMVDRNDRDAFAEKLKELAGNNNLRQELSKENLDRVRRYSTQNVAQMYVNSIFKN